METTKILFAALTSLMLLTSACGKSSPGGDAAVIGGVSGAGAGASTACINCTGFVAGSSVFSGTVASGAFRIDGLTVIADQNSLDTAAQTNSSPRIQGTYQGLVTGGSFTSSGSACIADGTYQVSGLQVGVISPNLNTQAASPLWVTLTGPTSIRAPMYIKLADTNSDDIGDAGTTVYIWISCSGWTSISMTAL